MTDEGDLAATAALLAAEHPDQPRYLDSVYLHWLYEENPAGKALAENIDRGGARVAHFASVPQRWHAPQAEGRIHCAANAVTRHGTGRAHFLGLLLRATRRTYDGPDVGGYGVTNQASTVPTFARVSIRSLGQLPVRVRPTAPWPARAAQSRVVTASWLASTEFESVAAGLDQRPTVGWAQQWPLSTLRWRLACPGARYAVHWDERVVLVTTRVVHAHVPITVVMKQFRRGSNGVVSTAPVVRAAVHFHRSVAAVYAGFNDTARFGGVSLPRRLLPAPLNLVFLGGDGASAFAGQHLEGLDQDEVDFARFELLDFDAL